MFIVAIAGTSGAGKTSLVRRLAQRLDAQAVFFDDYATSSQFPSDLAQWVRDGGYPSEWRTPQLAEDLGRWHDDPSELIVVLEEPFGRARPDVASLIDFCVFLEVPFEAALARKLLRDLGMASLRDDPARSRDYVRNLLERYLESTRDLYRTIAERAEASCDLAVDGERSLEWIEDAVVSELKRRGRT